MKTSNTTAKRIGARRLSAVLSVAVLSLTGCGAGAQSSSSTGAGKAVTWKSAWYVGPGQSTYDVGALTFEEVVEENSGGDIQVELYPSQQLGSATDSITMIETGVADEAMTASAYHSDVVPLLGAFDLPHGLAQDQIVEARWAAAHEEGPFVEQLKKAGLVPLVVSATPNYEISTTKSPIGGLDDLKGLQIRVSTQEMEKAMKLAGATGVTGPSSELFEVLERGVVDGTVFHYGSFDSSGIDGLMKHGTSNLQLQPTVVGSFVTQERWDELTEDQQRVMYAAARAASEKSSDAILQEVIDELPGLQKAGLKLYEWSQADVDEFYQVLETVTSDWIDEHGEEGQAAVDQVRELGEAATADDHSQLIDDFDSFQF